VHYLGGAWAEILGWGFVLVGLAAFTGVIAVIERRRRVRHARAAAAKLGRSREWDAVMCRAVKELARGPRVEALQADATVTVEAAEYAYNRLLMECAKHGAAPPLPVPEEPTPAPAEPVREVEPASAEERAPLAA
jgi:hypothetical protein